MGENGQFKRELGYWSGEKRKKGKKGRISSEKSPEQKVYYL